MVASTKKAKTPPKAKKAKKAPEKVSWVKFSGKTHSNDTNDVFLGVNGRTIVIKRNTEIPLPERFIKVAQDAKYSNYDHDKNGNRVLIDVTDRYPISILRPGTWADYVAYLKGGKIKGNQNIQVR